MSLFTIEEMLLKRQSVCLIHSEAKQCQNIRVWNRKKLIESLARRWVAPALKPPNSQKAFLTEKVREGSG